MLIKKLGKNNLGRDFVCGDIHGAYSCIMKFLQEIDFDFEKDRFFAVGDLIDRGPDSLKCLKLLKEPWFFSVLGNHEIFMYEYYKMVNDDPTADPMCYYWPRNGGMWGVDLINNDELNEVPELMKLVSELPTLISVDYSDNKRFHIIHAEVKPIDDLLPLLEEDFEEGKFQQIAFQRTSDGPFVYWGRDVFESLYGEFLDERSISKFVRRSFLQKTHHRFDTSKDYLDTVHRMYCGHTTLQKPLTFIKVTNLDTCAYGSYKDYPKAWCGLTVTEPATDKFWFVNDKEFKEVVPISVDYDIIESQSNKENNL